MSSDRVSRSLGPATANERSPTVKSRDGGMTSLEVDDRRRLLDVMSAVMWSETVGLTLRTRPVSDQKIGLDLGLAGLVLFCEKRSCHARRHNDLEGHSNFSSTDLSDVHLLKS